MTRCKSCSSALPGIAVANLKSSKPAWRRYQAPLPIYVGPAEAAAIISASGMETRRPSTVSAWQASLQVVKDLILSGQLALQPSCSCCHYHCISLQHGQVQGGLAICELWTQTEAIPVQAAGASVKRIVITRLVGHTYYARLVSRFEMQTVA